MKIEFKLIFKKLKVGDVVYEEQPRYIDFDYHPQEIKKIDLINYKIFVYEKGIKSNKWIASFHLYNKKLKKYEFYCQ